MSTSTRNSTRYSLNKTKFLLEPELLHFRRILKGSLETHPRDYFLFEMALRTGGRAQEVLNLRKVDMNPYDRTVFIRGLKGSSDREIPLDDSFYADLARWSELLQTDRLFPISYDRLHQLWEFYRPVKKKFHSLRHTFAIQLYKKTRDLRLVQVALGHRNIMNTIIYADYVYSSEELRKLIL